MPFRRGTGEIPASVVRRATDNRSMTTIDPGAIVGRAFRIYQEHAAPLIAAALIIFLIEAVASYVFDSGALVIVASLIGLVAHTFYQGVVVKLVDDVRDGTLDSSVGGLFSSVAPVVGMLLLVAILAGIALTIGFVLLIIPGLFLMTIWAVVAPAVVIEQRGLDAFGRSQALVKGNGWGVFGVIVIVFLLTVVVGIVAAAIGAAGGDVVRALVSLVATVAVAPLAALCVSVLFFQLRDGDMV